MPKRNVTVISHSVLTNHRIVAQAEEAFPDAAFHMTTPQLSDLVHLSANPTKQNAPPLLTQLQAYAQIILAHPEYRARYWSVAQQLKATHADNVYVLEALADEALQRHNPEGASLAIRYLQDAIHRGATHPSDFEELADLLVAAKRLSEAVDALRQGMVSAPYDGELYRRATKVYFALNEEKAACAVAANAVQRFPQDDEFRALLNRCGTAAGAMNN